MKYVYLVYVDNGEEWDDYRTNVKSVHETHKGATEWLLSEGFKVEKRKDNKNMFCKKTEDWDGDDYVYEYEFGANIFKFELRK